MAISKQEIENDYYLELNVPEPGIYTLKIELEEAYIIYKSKNRYKDHPSGPNEKPCRIYQKLCVRQEVLKKCRYALTALCETRTIFTVGVRYCIQ